MSVLDHLAGLRDMKDWIDQNDPSFWDAVSLATATLGARTLRAYVGDSRARFVAHGEKLRDLLTVVLEMLEDDDAK